MNELPIPDQIRAAVRRPIDDGAHPFLALGQRKTNGSVAGGTYPIDQEMANELRSVASETVARMERADMALYDGHAALDPEQGLWVPGDRLRDDAPLIDFLDRLDDVPALMAAQVRSIPLSFYAIGFGEDDDRVFFVRERARRINAAAKILGVLDGGNLRPLRSQVLSLETTVDFVLTEPGALVFGANAFERYIQEPAEIEAHVDEMTGALAGRLPIAEDALAAMKSKAASSPLLRGRLRSITQRPYFAALTLDRVRETIVRKGLNPGDFFRGEQLHFTEKNRMRLLKVLDQKVWTGDFDGRTYSTNAAVLEQ